MVWLCVPSVSGRKSIPWQKRVALAKKKPSSRPIHLCTVNVNLESWQILNHYVGFRFASGISPQSAYLSSLTASNRWKRPSRTQKRWINVIPSPFHCLFLVNSRFPSRARLRLNLGVRVSGLFMQLRATVYCGQEHRSKSPTISVRTFGVKWMIFGRNWWFSIILRAF